MTTTILLAIIVWIDFFTIILLLWENRRLNREIQELERENKDVEKLYQCMWDIYYKLLNDIDKSKYKDAFFKENIDDLKRKG